MSNLIQVKQSTTYPELFVHKYKKKVFYNNLWHTNPALLEARGHVYTADGKLVINAPTKVFNRNENGTDIDLNEVCLVVEKINGFMACATWVEETNSVVVSTTGSLDSDYVQMAKSYLTHAITEIKNNLNNHKGRTYFFEICHPDDPHIIPEKYGAYLLGGRIVDSSQHRHYSTYSGKELELDRLSKLMKVNRPDWYIHTFSGILYEIKSCKHEGYMVYGQESGTVLKLKSPYYLTCKAIARKKDILSLNRKRIDEEYYPLLDHLISMGDSFNQLDEQARLLYIKHYLENN